jgi:queuine tRNA-ribosyltransferase
MIAATLATIHNERFVVRLVDQMRAALKTGHFFDLKGEFMGRFKHKSGQHHD